jgi:hypothetical protein
MLTNEKNEQKKKEIKGKRKGKPSISTRAKYLFSSYTAAND